jgi:hypothetical protein
MCLVLTILLIHFSCFSACLFWYTLHCPLVVGEGPKGDSALEGSTEPTLESKLANILDRLRGLVVRVLGYRSGGPGSIPGPTRKKSIGTGTGSTQPREYKLRSYLIEK